MDHVKEIDKTCDVLDKYNVFLENKNKMDVAYSRIKELWLSVRHPLAYQTLYVSLYFYTKAIPSFLLL